MNQEVESEIYEAKLSVTANHYKQEYKMINEYEIHEELGQGSFGKVRRVTRHFKELEDGPIEKADYAMKIFNRSILDHQRTCFYENDSKNPKMTTMLEFALNEVNIWKYLNHPNICKMYEIIDDEDDPKDCIYIVMQLGNLGCLMNFDQDEYIYKRSQKIMEYFKLPLNECAKLIFRQIALGTQYLHNNGIVNRDLKLDNIICSSLFTIGESIKLIDFSTARYCQQGSKFYDCAGTAGFRAPEVQFCLTDGYDPFKLDIWSFGICLYIFFHEKLPFWGEGELEIDIKAKNDELQFTIDDPDLIDLINSCCSKDPAKRPNIEGILSHKWFN